MDDGTYNNVHAESATLTESKTKGTPGVEILFRLSEADGGEAIRTTVWLTDGAMKRSVQALRHCGWQGDDPSKLSTVGSRLCQIVVEQEEYNGKGYAKVKWINANEVAPAAGLAATLREKIIAMQGGPSAPAELPADISDDDVPFCWSGGVR